MFTQICSKYNILFLLLPIQPLFMYVPFQNVHGPLQVPDQYKTPYEGITNGHRRSYAGMTSALDEAVGNITSKLKESGLYNNSVIIFSTG